MLRRFTQLACWTVLIKLYLYLNVELYPESCQTSKMEHFAKIEHFAVYCFCKTLHLRQGSKYVSEICRNVTMPSLKNKMITACNRFSRIYLRHLLNTRVVDRLYCLAIVVKNIYFFTSSQSPRSSILIHLRKLLKLTLMKMRVNPSTRFNISFFFFPDSLHLSRGQILKMLI